MKIQKALYPGSFDPFTYGHFDILQSCLLLSQKVYLAIGTHPEKDLLFSLQERIDLIKESIKDLSLDDKKRIDIISFDGMMIHTARAIEAFVVFRGLRDHTDLDYEMRLASMNRAMDPDIMTVFIPSQPSLSRISSTFVRQIAHMGGPCHSFVPDCVDSALRMKFQETQK